MKPSEQYYQLKLKRIAWRKKLYNIAWRGSCVLALLASLAVVMYYIGLSVVTVQDKWSLIDKQAAEIKQLRESAIWINVDNKPQVIPFNTQVTTNLSLGK